MNLVTFDTADLVKLQVKGRRTRFKLDAVSL